MPTTLTSAGFDSGTSGNAITTSNTSFDGASSPGITFDGSTVHSGTLSAKVVNTAQGTRGLWWSSGSMGGNQATIFGRFYVKFGAAPPALVRWLNVQSGGNVLLGIGLTTSRTVQIRNVKAGSTVATSTTVLAANTWHRIEYSIAMSATAATITVRIYAAGNVDSTTITETISGSGLALAATTDSVMHGQAFAAAQTFTSWLDDVAMQVGTGATWLGPAAGGGGGGGGGGGDYTLKYDMNADTWNTTGHAWASLPSKLKIYDANQGQWGYTAPEHITSGTYADGTRYVQLAMKKLAAGAPHARFGAGDYGCRFAFADAGETSITTGRYQWTEEWTGAKKVKTSMMGWFDRNTRLTRDNGKDPHWPDAGERDLLEQWESTVGGKLTWHKGPLTIDPVTHKSHHPQSPHQWGNSVNTSKRTTFRVTITATKATMEVLQSDGTWRVAGTETDTSFFQPDRGYHYEGALAYATPNSSKNDPGRGEATRKISGLKVWSGTDPGGGGGGGTDSTPPTPDPPAAPTAVASTAAVAAIVTLSACTDAGSGIDYYEAQRAYDSVSSPGTPDTTALTTFTPLNNLTFTDSSVVGGDKVYYRERAFDQSGNHSASWSAWSSMLVIPTTTINPPQCVLAVAPDDGSADPGENVTVLDDGSPGVIFSAPATTGADTILVDPGYEGAPLLTILPADGATDPNTGQVLFIYPPGVGSYVAKGTAMNAGGADTDTAIVNVVAGTAGDTATPAPRDVWLVPGSPAYRAGDLVDNDVYMALALDQDDAVPRLARVNGFLFCVDKGAAGPSPDSGGGGNNDDPDLLLVSGNLTVASNVYPTGYTMGDDGQLTELRSYVETAPAGGQINVVWKLNGTAIGTVTILSGQTNGALTVNVTTAATDVLTWDVTAIGSTTPGANLHASWSGAV